MLRNSLKKRCADNQKTTDDGRVPYAKWDKHRGEAIERLREQYPDGFTYGKKIPPRNPENPPELRPEGFEPLNSKQWNHILYGERRLSSTPEAPKGRGGHGAGYGWIFELAEGVPRTEFPRDWSHKDIVHAIDETIARGKPVPSRHGLTYEHTVDGVPFKVATGRRKRGGYATFAVLTRILTPRK
ncbi:hypothetical protein DCC25_05630 [Auritidibacter sp. NML120636]|nr:hypothetical protein DCC25_05630 [Auritidibacter sp. NML120636]